MTDTAEAAPRARGGFWLIVGFTLGIQLMLLVTGVLTARLLGVEGRGQVALVAAATALLVRLTLGASVPVAVTQLLAREQLRARDALRPLWRTWVWQSALVGLLAGGYVAWVLADEEPRLRWGLALAGVVLTMAGIAGGILGGAIQGDQASTRRIALGGVALQAPFFVLLVVAFTLGWQTDALGVLVLQMAGAVPALLVCWWLLRPPTGFSRALGAREVREVARRNYVAAVGSINGLGLDRNLVGVLLGTAALGLYATAVAVANMCSVVATGVSTILLPRLSALAHDPVAARALRRQWLPATALLMLVIAGGLQLVVGPVIRLAFGEEFAPAIEVARWLIVADALLGFRRVQIVVLQAQGRGGTSSLIELVLTVVLVVAVVLAGLADRLVLVGVALAVVGLLSVLWQGAAIRRADRQAGPRHRA